MSTLTTGFYSYKLEEQQLNPANEKSIAMWKIRVPFSFRITFSVSCKLIFYFKFSCINVLSHCKEKETKRMKQFFSNAVCIIHTWFYGLSRTACICGMCNISQLNHCIKIGSVQVLYFSFRKQQPRHFWSAYVSIINNE